MGEERLVKAMKSLYQPHCLISCRIFFCNWSYSMLCLCVCVCVSMLLLCEVWWVMNRQMVHTPGFGGAVMPTEEIQAWMQELHGCVYLSHTCVCTVCRKDIGPARASVCVKMLVSLWAQEHGWEVLLCTHAWSHTDCSLSLHMFSECVLMHMHIDGTCPRCVLGYFTMALYVVTEHNLGNVLLLLCFPEIRATSVSFCSVVL